jgi:hypothetical protein
MGIIDHIADWFTETSTGAVDVRSAPSNVVLISDATVDSGIAFSELREAIDEERGRLLSHPLYDAVDTVPHLRAFMGVHVYAVWDFMCLAKRLQRDLTSMSPLWRPPPMPEMARFINGVILGEESDEGPPLGGEENRPNHEPLSHCELYLGAMDEVGASTASMRRFLELIGDGVAVDSALEIAKAPRAARSFVSHTLEVALEGSTVEVLASFLFGREDLIPDMFQRLLPHWKASGQAPKFTYYVERHIALDGDEHGPAAQRALMALAGTRRAPWLAARDAASEAIRARIALWDGVFAELR